MRQQGLLSAFRHRLPLRPNAPRLSLGEGNTPLLPLINTPLPEGISLYVKFEGANPTGSFKDRGMVAAVADAVAGGKRCVICASTGNTSASAAAYCAQAKLPCIVLIPAGKVAAGKIAQAVIYGANIIQIDGGFDAAMAAVKTYVKSGDAGVVNSINPMRLQGQKTAAFEIIEALGGAPDYHALPIGNAGNITAHWIGYCEAAGISTTACSFCHGACDYLQEIVAKSRPRMLGYQAENAAPFIHNRPIDNPQTIATAIRIGNPQSFIAAKQVITDSQGRMGAMSDEQILSTQKHLASVEGIFCEPASAVSVAGVLADIDSGLIPPPARIVCTLTGHGLKDPDIVGKPNARIIDSNINSIRRAIADIIK